MNENYQIELENGMFEWFPYFVIHPMKRGDDEIVSGDKIANTESLTPESFTDSNTRVKHVYERTRYFLKQAIKRAKEEMKTRTATVC